nr:MOSC domain-containing protein [Variibacter gotjawalensis]
MAVSARRGHHFSKTPQLSIRLVEGEGVDGDGHRGVTVKHRSRARFNPTLPNLRQVHLVHSELFDELRAQGYELAAGDIGENVLTRGIDLLGLPMGTRLLLGREAVVEVTGLRNPCIQMDRFREGLMQATLARAEDGSLIRKAGVMSVVVSAGDVRPGDPIAIELPAEPHQPLKPV